jgi:chromosome segregation ATPase
MSSDFSSKSITGEDIDDIYSLIKEKGPVFFDYLVNYVFKKREEEINIRLIEQQLQGKLESDKRFTGFSDYYWYLSELIPDKNLVSDKDIDKVEFFITNSKNSVTLDNIAGYLKKNDDKLFKDCLTYRLHQEERFLLVDKDLWNLRKEINKKVFRKPQEMPEPTPPSEPASIVELALVMDSILRDVEEVNEMKESQKLLVCKPAPVRYSLFDTDITGGCMKILPSMRHYFPDHPMIIEIKVCGRLKEYTAYINNRTGYLRGLEDWFKEMSLFKGDVILVIPMDQANKVYRFFTRNEKNPYPNESWRLKQFQNLKTFYKKSPLSLTNLVLQVARAFQEVEVHFDSIYDEINAICPVSKELVSIILNKLPFCQPGNKDFWTFDDNKFNKFLILGFINLTKELSSDVKNKVSIDTSSLDENEKTLKKNLKAREERVKELEELLQVKEKILETKKHEAEDALAKMTAFEKLAEIRVQQISSLNGNVEELENKLREMKQEMENTQKSSIEGSSIEIKQLKKKLLSMQELFLNKKKLFIQLEKEKKELEKALLEMDKITSTLEKEKKELLKQIETVKKETEEEKKKTDIDEDRFNEQQGKIDEFNRTLEKQNITIEEHKKKLEEQEKSLEEYREKLEEQEKSLEEYREKLKEQETSLEEKNKEIEEQLQKITEQEDRINLQEQRITEQDDEISARNQETEELKAEKTSLPEKEIPAAITDEQSEREYELKIKEKEHHLLEVEDKLSKLEKIKLELEDTGRNQKNEIEKISSLIEEKDSIIKDLQKQVETSKTSILPENEESLTELKERLEILEHELESKTNLYNTNLNMQFKLNKDIYKLQKKVDYFKDVITFISEAMTALPDKNSLNLTRIEELLTVMKGEEIEEELSVINTLKTLEETAERLDNINNTVTELNNTVKELEEMKESCNTYKEELDIAMGFKEQFEIASEQINKLNKELEKLNSELNNLRNYNSQLKQEIQGIGKSFMGSRVMTKRLKSLLSDDVN